ncbi:phytanoyl-CoA dioxygenase family protein [Actinopolymorpha alba]|uniref:phytanoyl-CoA dioxygenase family protein n=1 Tax=Actinopolymorpha alba TaxID=533267 RepID=UPI00036AC975|nr:phytanoyl-CoA dioxygenase family protein [Actinopolymorpha alba]
MESRNPESRKPSPLDDFLFDLRGYLILENAVEPELLGDLIQAFDEFPDLEPGEWWGNAQRRDYTEETGFELHNCVEAGEPFERLIDHPSWIEYVLRYAGEDDSYVRGVFIDECIASIRRSGGHHPVHSGGYRGAMRGAYRYLNGVFRCGQVNIIVALTDIGDGDGATMVIPGSHKSNFPHPLGGDYARGDRMDTLPGAIPVHLRKGDALLFIDGLMHGGSSRTNPGERRILIYRYGPSWARTRFGYEYSRPLLDRLSPERRRILEPVPPSRPPAV